MHPTPEPTMNFLETTSDQWEDRNRSADGVGRGKETETVVRIRIEMGKGRRGEDKEWRERTGD